MSHSLRFVPCGDRSLLLYLGEEISDSISDRVLTLARALKAAAHPAVLEVTHSYHAVMVEYDPVRLRLGQLEEMMRAAAGSVEVAVAGQTLEVPVCYGGEAGPDLEAVATHAGLTAGEVVRLHAEPEYRVYCLGFSPGFPFLGGLHPSLHTPRLAEPRTRVPAGSVAIGGAQTGVYPSFTPGGWQLIGQTPLTLFDPRLPQPALVKPGDRIRFRPISAEQYASLRRGASQSAASLPAISGGHTGLRMIQPGLQTTVQDLGRRGYMSYGVSLAGAADFRSLMIGNWLLSNRARTAGLEITLSGPEIEFTGPVTFCLTGAPIFAELIPGDGGSPRPVPGWTAILASPGDRLRIGTVAAGCRSYLCVAGGIDLPPVLGSLSEDLFGGVGPVGRALRTGDWLPVGLPLQPPADLAGRYLPADAIPSFEPPPALRVLPGPQSGAFEAEALEKLCAEAYQVGAQSDRQGLRLEGARLLHRAGADILSEPIPPGSIQAPANGQPILLLGNRQTLGGYTKIAVALYPELALAAQLRPGDRLRFAVVSQAEALANAWAERRRLAQVRRYLEREVSRLPEAAPDPIQLRGSTIEAKIPAAAAEVPLPAPADGPPVNQVRAFRISIGDVEYAAEVEEITHEPGEKSGS